MSKEAKRILLVILFGILILLWFAPDGTYEKRDDSGNGFTVRVISVPPEMQKRPVEPDREITARIISGYEENEYNYEGDYYSEY